MKVYFITHSTSKDNEAGLSSGWKDAPLSKTGIQQAKEISARLESMHFNLICCSDLIRSIETVRIAFGERFPVAIDKRLREINYGTFNGKPVDLVDPMNKKWIKIPFPDGESYENAIARIHDFYRELKTNRPQDVILIVGHRATKYGLDTFSGKITLEECLSYQHWWQPFWTYEL